MTNLETQTETIKDKEKWDGNEGGEQIGVVWNASVEGRLPNGSGNHDTDVEANGRSGGMLIIWDSNMFHCKDAMCDDRILAVKGLGLMGNDNDAWWIFRDFNVIRSHEDRLNSQVSVKEMDDFNNFINTLQLVEISMGGRKFTQVSVDGLKFSKLDRLLVTEGFKSKWGNLAVLALDRKLSDHCPIVLKDLDVDFGPKPFRVFDIWLKEVDIVEKGQILRQKARMRWDSEGDENYKFFHSYVKRKNNKNSIRGLMVDGEWCKNLKKIKDETHRFYRFIFSERDWLRPSFLSGCMSRLSIEDAKLLEFSFEKKEIWDVVNSCGVDKAPGPDGFNFRFIKRFWEIFKPEIMNAIKWFWDTKEISRGCNSYFMALIPKVTNPIGLGEYRPISLIGSCYKIIAKLLAERIKQVIGKLMGDVQNDFIGGRFILDGILIANEKIDYPTAEFRLEHGVRQGDPLSSFLVILAAEGLNAMVNDVMDKGVNSDEVVNIARWMQCSVWLSKTDRGPDRTEKPARTGSDRTYFGPVGPVWSLKKSEIIPCWTGPKTEPTSTGPDYFGLVFGLVFWPKSVSFRINGGLDDNRVLMELGGSGVCRDIVKVGIDLDKIEMGFSFLFLKKLGNRGDTLFWKDKWIGNVRLCNKFPSMIAFLTKSDASEGFDQIVDFLNAHMIQYALMVNPTIYVSCIKQFWTSVSIKKSNDVVRFQALIDRKNVIITKDSIRQALRLDDSDGVDCLLNEEIFVELARTRYEKPSTKYMSAKRTAWNEFSSSMASVVICLATSRKFNFSKYIFDNMVRNVDSPSKFLMYPRFLQLMINTQVDDLSSHNTKYTSPALIQKVFANIRMIGKGFSGVDTPLFDGMLVQQQVQAVEDAAEDEDDDNEVSAEPTPPSPTPATPAPSPTQEHIPSPPQAQTAQPSSPPPQQPS
nr:putative RNA-directed DNA polymerase, eukaryota [Tanacetum cinerariifolium]